MEQLGFGTCGGERDADPCRGLGDASGDLDQPHTQGGELGRGERLWFGNGFAHRRHQPVGGGVQHQANLVGQGGAAACAIGGELAFVQLDQVLHLAARRLVTTQRMSSPSVVASILAEIRRLHSHDLAP